MMGKERCWCWNHGANDAGWGQSYSTRRSQFVRSLSDRLSHFVTSALLCALLLLNLLVLMLIKLYIIIPVSGYFLDSVILGFVGLFDQYSLNSHYFCNFSNAPLPQATLHIPWNTLYTTIFYDVVTWNLEFSRVVAWRVSQCFPSICHQHSHCYSSCYSASWWFIWQIPHIGVLWIIFQ